MPTAIDEQRRRALLRANHVRIYRASVKRAIAQGERRLSEVLAEGDLRMRTAHVSDLLEQVPRIGEVRARRIMVRAQIGPYLTVDQLKPDQVRALKRELGVSQ
jgi:hypothetical protein